jgi:hypothetical protein
MAAGAGPPRGKPVRVLVLHPIAPVLKKHPGCLVIADGGVDLELGQWIPQEPLRDALFELPIVQAAQA